jgi:hypothetical protein
MVRRKKRVIGISILILLILGIVVTYISITNTKSSKEEPVSTLETVAATEIKEEPKKEAKDDIKVWKGCGYNLVTALTAEDKETDPSIPSDAAYKCGLETSPSKEYFFTKEGAVTFNALTKNAPNKNPEPVDKQAFLSAGFAHQYEMLEPEPYRQDAMIFQASSVEEVNSLIMTKGDCALRTALMNIQGGCGGFGSKPIQVFPRNVPLTLAISSLGTTKDASYYLHKIGGSAPREDHSLRDSSDKVRYLPLDQYIDGPGVYEIIITHILNPVHIVFGIEE